MAKAKNVLKGAWNRFKDNPKTTIVGIAGGIVVILELFGIKVDQVNTSQIVAGVTTITMLFLTDK